MTQRSRLWNGSTTGDATEAPYDAPTEFAQVFMSIAGAAGVTTHLSGVFRNELNQLAGTGVATPVSINTGRALVYGAWYENDVATTVAIPTPAAATRIDRIVLRKDWLNQTVRITRIAGVEGGGVPAMTQVAGTTWDMPLVQASITTGGVITVTDERNFIGGTGFPAASGTNSILTSTGGVAAWSATPTIGGALTISIANAHGGIIINSTTGTNAASIRFTNTGGNGYAGLDSSTGAVFGGSAYGLSLFAPATSNIELIPGATTAARVTIATSGATTIRGATTITTGGLTVSAGGLTVSAGGAAITGNSTITGTLTSTSTLTVNAGGAAITGNSTITGTFTSSSTLTVTAGGIIVTAGGLRVTAGNVGVGTAPTANSGLTVATANTSDGSAGGYSMTNRGGTITAAVNSDALFGFAMQHTFALAGKTGVVSYGIDISPAWAAGNVNYGIRINAVTAGTNNYGMYIVAPSGGTTNIGLFNGGSSTLTGQVTFGSAAAWTTTDAGTSASYGQFLNTGGVLYVGRDGSTGGTFYGVAYSGVIGVGGAYPLVIATNAVIRARFDAVGLQIGATVAARSTTEPAGAINIYNGTAPVGTLTNGITLYAAAGELRVMDSGGTSTLLSPHDDDGRWVFDSTDINNRRLKIDVEKLLRAVNEHFEWDFVKEFVVE